MNDNTISSDTSSVRYDSADSERAVNDVDPDLQRDDRHTVRTYVSDMLALERHIGQPLQRQLDMDDSAKYGEAAGIISSIKSICETHIAALEQELKAAGGDAASPIKTAFASVVGAGAAVIDSARKSKVSKNLRDDQTALALATISYTMLNATALGLGDSATARLAQTHLEDYTPIVTQISKAMPAVVLQELADDGENVQITAAEIASRSTQEAWQK